MCVYGIHLRLIQQNNISSTHLTMTEQEYVSMCYCGIWILLPSRILSA